MAYGAAAITMSNVMDEGLLDRLGRVAARLLRDTPIFLAYAHGSRVSGHARPDSDLDVGYYRHPLQRDRALSLRTEMGLAAALSEAVGCPVDLRDLAAAPLELRGRVLEQGRRIFCSDQTARVNLERDVLGRYHDYKEVFQHMHDIRLRQLARGG